MLRAAIILLLTAIPAQAMNWEGHTDDWDDLIPHAMVYEDAVPSAKPLPGPDCPVTASQAETNPYEQIPLPRHNCRPEQLEAPLTDP